MYVWKLFLILSVVNILFGIPNFFTFPSSATCKVLYDTKGPCYPPCSDISRVFVSFFVLICFIPSLSVSQASGSTQIRFVQPESKLNPAQDQDGPPKARPGSVGGLKSGASPRYLYHFFPSRDIDAHQQWSKNSCIWILYSPICCKVRDSTSLLYFGFSFLPLSCLFLLLPRSGRVQCPHVFHGSNSTPDVPL
jgi:hypothetical protein